MSDKKQLIRRVWAAFAAALAGTLLAEERIVRVEDADLFVKHVDRDSRVVSYILRPGLAADNQQSLYFTAKSMTDDGRFLVFWISDNEFTFKSTKERPERLIAECGASAAFTGGSGIIL